MTTIFISSTSSALRLGDLDGNALGKVLAVPNYGAGDILEVGGTGLETRLIPFTRAAVPEVHLAGGYLVVVPPTEIEGEDLTEGSESADGEKA